MSATATVTVPPAQTSSTKDHILEQGVQLVIEQGFNHTGLNEILKAAGVPKGSFYHYFSSKEDFGLQMIAFYVERYQDRLQRYFENDALSPKAQLAGYMSECCQEFVANGYKGGCLFGNLAQEMASQHPAFRAALIDGLSRWKERLRTCLSAGQQCGEFTNRYTPDAMVDMMIIGFEGALLKAKVTQSTEPFHLVSRLLIGPWLTDGADSLPLIID